jgi:pimeloyl-ACP methyl ester carboxylesterase
MTRFLAAALLLITMVPGRQVPVDRAGVERDTKAFRKTLDSASVSHDRMADAEVFWKAAEWALRYDSDWSDGDLRLLYRMLERGRVRLAALQSKSAPWETKRGKLVRAYVSDVDGSVQPYGLIIPRGYDPARPIRLDVVLHGSTRPVGMSEARFLAGFDEGDSGGNAPDVDYIELHPLGRVENCYRWAGETDVFEAIESVCRRYYIDRDRIVLRGMSMGASGTWHLGLKHPDRFVALGPYCGYVDTHRFSETPGMNFVRVGPLSEVQEDGLHMLDSVDYAANAGVVPEVAAIGEKDPFFQAHVIMGEAMRREGLTMVNLISPGTGHVQEPATFAEQMRRIGVFAWRGLDRKLRHIRFVTWTLKYPRCHWIEILGLERHYRRAEVDADLADDGTVRLKEPQNITRLALDPPSPVSAVVVSRTRISVRGGGGRIVLEKRNGTWAAGGKPGGKRPGIQGPIDDAFTTRFLCVRPTGTPWNPRVNAWAEASLLRFAYEWARYFRGDLPVKDDIAVTDEDRRSCNLILFGDPGSNKLIREATGRMPVHWTRDWITTGEHRFEAADHAPAFIAPSPFAPSKYVVINSGHTFHEAELNRLNYLLFPRLGDWAVFRIPADSIPSSPSGPLPEEPVRTGWFNEQWRITTSSPANKRVSR